MFFNIWNLCSIKIRRIASIMILFGSLASCTTLSGKAGDQDPEITGSIIPSEYGRGEDRVLFRTASVIMQRNKGYEKIGKPYQVKGVWYYPARDPNYVKTGKASWYGKAFHGKLTANGEIFDLNQITAAHPTMPLPSYAKVTNLANDSSLVVRVNDRGPFARNRIIDLSHRAAQLLGYVKHGVADVRVEYIGPAPIGGQDHARLVSSYSPGQNPADKTVALALLGDSASSYMEQAILQENSGAPTFKAPLLPEYGPRLIAKPSFSSSFSEMDTSVRKNHNFNRILAPETDSTAEDAYIALGTFNDRAKAEYVQNSMAAHGHINNRQGRDERGNIVYSLELSDITTDLNNALQKAWTAGASDAFVVRPE